MSPQEVDNNGIEIVNTPMMSVTALINPLDATEALLFYCTTTMNLAVEHRALNPAAQSTIFQDNNIQTGNITQPGDFGAVLHNKLVHCYGITNFMGGDGKVANVASQLSPAINPLDQITNPPKNAPASPALTGNFNALAATTDGQFNDFICFITPNPVNTALPIVTEYTMTVDSPSSVTYPGASGLVLPNSRLAMCYRTDDPNGNRYIFCQSNLSGNPLMMFSTDTGMPNSINGTNNASPGNPMAVTTASDISGKMNMYLFYMDNSSKLNKVTYTGATQSWSTPVPIASGIQAGSGIAAVNDGKSCYVFYAKSQQTVFTMTKTSL